MKSDDFSKFFDAGVLITISSATLILLGYQFELYFQALVGIPKTLFKPNLENLVTTGWGVLWSVSVGLENVLMIVFFVTLFYILFFFKNTSKYKLKASLTKIKTLSTVLFLTFLLTYYVPVKAASQAVRLADCLRGEINITCELFPFYDLVLKKQEDIQTLSGRLLRESNGHLALITCTGKAGKVTITKASDLLSATLSSNKNLLKTCNADLFLDKLTVFCFTCR